MLEARQIADFAVVCAREAVDRVISFIQTDPPPFEDAAEPEMALIESRHRAHDEHGDRSTYECHAAMSLLMGARNVLYPAERELADFINPDDGYRLLRDGDLDGALALADTLLRDAARTPADDWNYSNLVHHGHVLRGKVYLAQDDPSASAIELAAAGDVAGSPQLDSFGPDLSLAWTLLKLGHDEAVLAYLKAIARFWSPRDPLGDRVDGN